MTSHENFQSNSAAELAAGATDQQVDVFGFMELRSQRGRDIAASRADSLLVGQDGEFEVVDPTYLQERLQDDPQPPRDAS